MARSKHVTVTTPVEGYGGTVAGVTFVNGSAKVSTTDDAALAYFRRHGYNISGEETDEPVKTATQEANEEQEAEVKGAQADQLNAEAEQHDAEAEKAEKAGDSTTAGAAKTAAAAKRKAAAEATKPDAEQKVVGGKPTEPTGA